MSTNSFDVNRIDVKDIYNYLNECSSGIDFNTFLNNTQQTPQSTNKKNTGKNIKITNCISCNKNTIIEDFTQGILVCTSCGQVSENIIDYNPEWNQFNDENDNKVVGRCGYPINVLLPQSSLGTTLLGSKYNKIRTLHIWSSMPYRERSLNNEFKKIHDICLKSKILKCVEDDAKIMYKITSDCKKDKGKFIITRGVNRISISAACVFFSCIKNGVSRTVEEIADMFEISSTEMNKGCKNLTKYLRSRHITFKIGVSKPEQFVDRFCDDLRIKQMYKEEAIKIAKNLEKLHLASSHTPYSLASACILLMADIYGLKSITKKKLALTFDISDVTIFKTFKEIYKYKHILINDNSTDKLVEKINEHDNKHQIPDNILQKMKQFDVFDEKSNKEKLNELVSECNELVEHKNNFLNKSVDQQLKFLNHLQKINKEIVYLISIIYNKTSVV